MTQWDSSWPKFLSQDERDGLFACLGREFGIPATILSPYELLKTSRLYYLLRHHKKIDALRPLKIQNAGLPAIRIMKRHLKPTTEFIRSFGQFFTKRLIIVGSKALMTIATKKTIELSELTGLSDLSLLDKGRAIDIRSISSLETGFYLIKCREIFWGSVFIRDNILISYFSKNINKTVLSMDICNNRLIC